MKITTAINQIKKESTFLGLSFVDTLLEIENLGSMVFGKETMSAYFLITSKNTYMSGDASKIDMAMFHKDMWDLPNHVRD